MKTILRSVSTFVALVAVGHSATFRMPGQRRAGDVPDIPVNPFVNSAQEVANAANKQEQVPPAKLFEAQLAKTSVTGLFWDTLPSRRSVLLSGFILHLGDTFPRELWEGGGSFTVKTIEVNRIAFAVPGSPDEVIYKAFELLSATPRRANGKAPVPLDPTGTEDGLKPKSVSAAPAGAAPAVVSKK